jgi:tryptophan 2,3-dioxygenase
MIDIANINPDIIQKLRDLEAKYELTGQDLMSNLEGLQVANYLKYWDYIHLDTLLSLQNTRTDFPDEKIFIIYHQITELYFQLILWEIQQIAAHKDLTSRFFLDKMLRINRYFKNLAYSFDVMVDGMEFEQFRQFRMALLPASGFQSAQFRKIEICATDFIHLINKDYQPKLSEVTNIALAFKYVYWKQGATDEITGKETITLQHFLEKYEEEFIDLIGKYEKRNLWQCYTKLPADEFTPQLQEALREFDGLININWRLSHFRSAVRYLKTKELTLDATGGTNWQKYLPPRFQKVIFYPELWTVEEKEDWGRGWVNMQLGFGS